MKIPWGAMDGIGDSWFSAYGWICNGHVMIRNPRTGLPATERQGKEMAAALVQWKRGEDLCDTGEVAKLVRGPRAKRFVDECGYDTWIAVHYARLLSGLSVARLGFLEEPDPGLRPVGGFRGDELLCIVMPTRAP